MKRVEIINTVIEKDEDGNIERVTTTFGEPVESSLTVENIERVIRIYANTYKDEYCDITNETNRKSLARRIISSV